MDSMGNPLEMMADAEDDGIVGGGTEDPEADSVSTKIIVNGVNVMVNAGDCDGGHDRRALDSGQSDGPSFPRRPQAMGTLWVWMVPGRIR